jgi:16S rRNA C967 or C1407 C5-methylase (RsmB/RsmF family)
VRPRFRPGEAVRVVRQPEGARTPLGEEWPEYAHPRRPEFLLTLPHRHATSGFFIARLRR